MNEAQILITVKANGEVQLQTNLPNLIAIYGALEAGKDAVRKSFAERANGSGIVAAPAEALKQLQTN